MLRIMLAFIVSMPSWGPAKEFKAIWGLCEYVIVRNDLGLTKEKNFFVHFLRMRKSESGDRTYGGRV